MTVKPKKYLGQHFLHDKNIAKKIVNLLKPAKTIIEIGAGTGALSKWLYEKYNDNVLFFDIDKESVSYLILQLKIPEKQVICENFLLFDLSHLNSPVHIIGNFPYNISSQLFFKILDNKDCVYQVVCMIQKEVAERIISKEGSKKYGILSVLLQTYYDISYHFNVNENVFIPAPKVKSAVIELIRNKDKLKPFDEEIFRKVVKTAFNQRRKILSNSLSSIINKNLIPEEYLNKRPEMLTKDDFIRLSNIVYQNQ